MFARLLIEHDHLRKTLNLLEMQFLDLCRGRALDYSMMLSIVAYIQEYPERAHHPLEDAIFSVVLKHGEQPGRLARELIADHTELEGVTRQLRESLESLNADDSASMDKLKRDLSTFLSRQRRHLYVEEMHVYPLVASLLTERDWAALRDVVSRFDAQVFGERTGADYEALARMIEGRSGAGR